MLATVDVCALLFRGHDNQIRRRHPRHSGSTLQAELQWSETDYGDVVSGQPRVRLRFLVAGHCWIASAYPRLRHRRGHLERSGDRSRVRTHHSGILGGASVLALVSRQISRCHQDGRGGVPKRERAARDGHLHAGTNTGAIITPLLVPWIALTWGWQWAFIVTGSLGFLWLAVWLAVYRSPEQHPRVSASELTYIRSDPDNALGASVPWLRLLGYRQTWAFVTGKLLADPVWWFYLYWLPKFLDTRHGIKLAQVALPLIVVYLVADVGSVVVAGFPAL